MRRTATALAAGEEVVDLAAARETAALVAETAALDAAEAA